MGVSRVFDYSNFKRILAGEVLTACLQCPHRIARGAVSAGVRRHPDNTVGRLGQRSELVATSKTWLRRLRRVPTASTSLASSMASTLVADV
jgi:hypothetical protein